MNTIHKIYTCDATDTSNYISDGSVNLVVTSPPYPMIEMWDKCFSNQSKKIKSALNNTNFDTAFNEMHLILDKVWEDVDRVLMDGGIACINVGDATRKCGERFKLYSNHSRIIEKFVSLGFDVLPDINWRKQTNAPNKFMGSGMYPPCAYVTYEHEYILIFRKGKNRVFNNSEKENRHNSAYFWEERNVWFSDLWDLKGISQKLNVESERERSAAFPYELVYRLINMYSVQNDTVYDPFVGTGTAMQAAMASQRNSIGVEIDKKLASSISKTLLNSKIVLNNHTKKRVAKHNDFISNLPEEKKSKLYDSNYNNFKVKTQQEKGIRLPLLNEIKSSKQCVEASYKDGKF